MGAIRPRFQEMGATFRGPLRGSRESGSQVTISGRDGSQVKTVRADDTPKVTLVTPVAQAVEMAQSELKREANVIRGGKRQMRTVPGPPGKRLRELKHRNGYLH